ncbi:MAG: glycosyltransferase family 4 protein [Muribaculum sp.]|nr:glycosyltransferase family 4 protein [Muribaculum sp.]
MKDEILYRVGSFEVEEFTDICYLLTKIPYLKGIVRKFNWTIKINKIAKKGYTCLYLPFSWSGNSGKVKIRKVITIHDLRPMKEATRAFTGSMLFKFLNLKKIYLAVCRKFYTDHVKNANDIIAISNYVKSDIVHEWSCHNKIHTIYNSISKSKLIPKEIGKLKSVNYILYVNTLSPYKNILTLVRAFKKLKQLQQFNNIILVIVGKATTYWEKNVLPEIAESKLANEIVRFEYVSDSELIWLYKNANIFITASIHEGFGYTPIEAALYCCPVISTRCESLPDVTANKVSYYDPPTSEEELYKVMTRILNTPKNKAELNDISLYFQERYSIITHKNRILNLLKNNNNEDIIYSSKL